MSSPPQRLALVAVHVVPPITGEESLIEQSAVGAEETAALLSLPSIVAYVIRLAASLGVGVHARKSWYIVAAEGGVWNCVVNGIIVSRHSGNVLKLLLLGLLLRLLVPTTDDDGSVIVVDLFVLGLGVLDSNWRSSSQGLVVLKRRRGTRSTK